MSVDEVDPSVGMTAPQDFTVQHPGQNHIAGIDRLPGDLLHGIDFAVGFTNDIELSGHKVPSGNENIVSFTP
jgi:hypothetical protein